jgi:hypothetical protein
MNYVKYYKPDNPDNFSIWKIDDGQEMCIYNDDSEYYTMNIWSVYHPPSHSWREDPISEEEVFLLVL